MKKRISLLLAIALVLTGFSYVAPYVHASASVGTPATANVSSDSATGTSVTLPAIVITEGAAGDLAVGTDSFTTPSGYVWDTSSVPNLTCSGTSCTVGTASFTGTTVLNVPITHVSTAAGSLTIGGSSTLKVKAAAGTPMAAAGNITLTAGTINGLSGSSNFGTLTQVVGAANKAGFTAQPSSIIPIGSTFSVTVAIQDQFGNTRTADTNTISLFAAEPNSTSVNAAAGQPTGTTSAAAVAGVKTFSGLAYNSVATVVIRADVSGLTSGVSNVVSFTGSSSSASAKAPASTVTSPVNGSTLTPGANVTINGTDTQGSSSTVQKVEISFDGGTTWMATTLTATGWTYNWTVPASGTITIQTRATDWLGKVETPGTGVTVTVASSTPATPATPSTPATPGQNGTPATRVTPATPATPAAPAPSSQWANGTLVKVNGSGTVYMVVNGVLRPFTSAAIFHAQGKKFTDVQTVSSSDFASATVGQPVGYPAGTAIKGSAATVYVVSADGGKQGIPSMAVFKKLGLKSIVKVSDSDLGTYADEGIAQ